VSAPETWPGQQPAPADVEDEHKADEEAEENAEAEPAVDAEADEESAAEEETGDQEAVAEPESEPDAEAEPQLRLAGHAPGELAIPDDVAVLEGTPSAARRAVGIVASRFNGEVTNRLLESALGELERLGVEREFVTVTVVPGAFELPLGAMALAKTRRYACIVALGCVIRGETAHFDYVAGEAASGIQLAALETGVPVAFGVLTVDTLEQAEARTDKGAEAVRTALEMADLFAQIRHQAQAAR
jgi:6,7-dimethyl-8-ribityllumazine synthase